MKATIFIFDVEGTLIDCAANILKCWHETLAIFGCPVPISDLQSLSGLDGDEMLKALVPDLAQQTRKQIIETQSRRYSANYLSQARAFPGVRGLFTAIKSRGGRIALATDCEGSELKRYRGLMGVDDLIDAIACGDDVSMGKPDPGLVELALRHLGAAASQAVMVGDTPFDAMAARRAGVEAWGTLGGGCSEASLADAGCSLVVAALADFERHL